MQGWIKLHRKLLDWEWYHDSKMVHLFLHLVLEANHQDKKWRGQTVKRGQIITGRKSLSQRTGLSQQSIRTCLNKLKSTSEITIQPTNRFSLITICNYEAYNTDKIKTNQLINQPAPNKQPTTNQQLTTNKNVKNDKNNTYTLEQVKNSAFRAGISDEQTEQFYHHFNAQNWIRSNGQQITDLNSQLVNWKNNGFKIEAKNGDDRTKKNRPTNKIPGIR